MAGPNDRVAPPTAPRWMRVLLVVSLAVNLLIAGGVIGAAVTGGGPWRGHALHGGGGPMARALSDEDRRILRSRMHGERAPDLAARQAHRDAMRDLIRLLRATPYDSGAVTVQMAQIRGHFETRMARGQALLAERLAEMTAAERAAYADRLEAALRRRLSR
ncbi:periplasmic heavy metal sensor [Roseovarius aestuariivivens]|uniref:periplasmic heavy metal sensor n=1 Tax=Roseovarius aestuariivivens TaxID=1888910 RepID=UPI001081EF02|nr:periplasmic heavy metal sensor [Roseovarius aestuariivivens]